MQLDAFGLAFREDVDLPPRDATDQVLVRWLRRRLGREPSWLEVLALRAALYEQERRRARWAWWRRWLAPVPPEKDALVADFLRSWEGQALYRLVGGMAGLMAQLALPDPWQGFDGRHPRAPRPTRREGLQERAAAGLALPLREQVSAILAYADWKLRDRTEVSTEFPDSAEFLSPAQAAAINVMSETAVLGICAQLQVKGGPAGCRAALRELDRAGCEAMAVWPGIERRSRGAPLGIWPLSMEIEGADGASAMAPPPPEFNS